MRSREGSVATALFETAYTLRYRIKSLLGKGPRVRMLYLEVTHRCNARCITCYTKAGKEKEDVLTLDEKKSVVRQAKELGARVISLSGSGEPLLYPHLFDLIDFIRQLDMLVVIFTNGTVLDEKTAEFLIQKGVITYFKLFSLDPDTFDRMIGKERAYNWVPYSHGSGESTSHTHIPSGLKCLLQAQDLAKATDLVRIETLIAKTNCRTLPAVAQFCKDHNLMLHLETPVFAGRAVENYHDIALDSNACEALYRELVEILGQAYFDELRAHPCPVERNPVVWTNGDIGLCSSRSANIGNVRNVPLKKLFLKAQMVKQREDRRCARLDEASQFFRTCPARRYYNVKNQIHCNY